MHLSPQPKVHRKPDWKLGWIPDGFQDGCLEGSQDGSLQGFQDGQLVGLLGGISEGFQDGTFKGFQIGTKSGFQDGKFVGFQAWNARRCIGRVIGGGIFIGSLLGSFIDETIQLREGSCDEKRPYSWCFIIVGTLVGSLSGISEWK